MASTEIGRTTTAPPHRARRKARFRLHTITATQVGLLLLLLGGWQFGVSDKSLPYFSRPTIVAARLVDLLSHAAIYDHIVVTLAEIAVGYVMGAIVGLSLGYALGRSAFLSATLQPFVIGLYSIPKIALAPVFIVWLGLGMASKIAVVFLSSFFLIFFNTYSGLIAVNEELVNLARLMGASWIHVVVRVIVPAASSQIFIGLKTAVPYAVIGAVIGEYIGSNEGLGYFILYASQTYDAPSLFAGIAILVAIVFATNATLSWIEKKTIRWKRSARSAVQI
jgi:NitT/TauT family transport system permease protein